MATTLKAKVELNRKKAKPAPFSDAALGFNRVSLDKTVSGEMKSRPSVPFAQVFEGHQAELQNREAMYRARKYLEFFCQAPRISLTLELRPEEWVKLQCYANSKQMTLDQAATEIIAGSDEVLNPD